MEQKLIDSALGLTGKTIIEDITEIMPDGGGYEYQDDFCIEKFFYYLLSPEFIEKYSQMPNLFGYNPDVFVIDFALAIYKYQSNDSQPLIDLLSKI